MPMFEILSKVRLEIYADSLGDAVKSAERMESLYITEKDGTHSGLTIIKSDIFGVNAKHVFNDPSPHMG